MRNTNKYMTVSSFLALFCVLMFYVGCKSDSASGPAGSTTGSLTVAIVGLPGGLNASVTVTGPNSFNQVLTATQTLSSLAVGTYTVTVNNVATAASIVSELYQDSTSSSTISVTAGATALDSVKYAVRSGSGKLWVPLFAGHSFGGYTPSQLVVSGSPTPNVAIGTSVNNEAVTFDRSGNAWVVTSFTNNTIFKYTPSQMASSGTPTPAVMISANSGSLNNPVGMAFDANGNLWIGNFGNSTLAKYTTSQLISSGSPAPSVIIGGSALSNPIGVAFDASNNLWVSNLGKNTIVKYTPGQLTSTGTPTPDTLSGSAISAPRGLAFDVNGNLWVASSGFSKLLMFTPGQLAGSGNPTPTVTISATAGSLNIPQSVAFDNSGSLWVVNVNGTMVQFSAAQLVSSGSPAPVVTISGLGSVDVAQLAFNPPPPNLPIYR